MEVSAQTFQVGAHFEALIEGVLMAPLKTFESVFGILSSPVGLWYIFPSTATWLWKAYLQTDSEVLVVKHRGFALFLHLFQIDDLRGRRVEVGSDPPEYLADGLQNRLVCLQAGLDGLLVDFDEGDVTVQVGVDPTPFDGIVHHLENVQRHQTVA